MTSPLRVARHERLRVIASVVLWLATAELSAQQSYAPAAYQPAMGSSSANYPAGSSPNLPAASIAPYSPPAAGTWNGGGANYQNLPPGAPGRQSVMPAGGAQFAQAPQFAPQQFAPPIPAMPQPGMQQPVQTQPNQQQQQLPIRPNGGQFVPQGVPVQAPYFGQQVPPAGGATAQPATLAAIPTVTQIATAQQVAAPAAEQPARTGWRSWIPKAPAIPWNPWNDAAASDTPVLGLPEGPATGAAGDPTAIPTPAASRGVVVRLPVPQISETGEIVIQPNIAGADVANTYKPQVGAYAVQQAGGVDEPVGTSQVRNAFEWGALNPFGSVQQATALQPATMAEPVPTPAGGFTSASYYGQPTVPGQASPIFGDVFGEEGFTEAASESWLGEWSDGYYGEPMREAGIGRERVAFALFEIDSTQPQASFTFRTQAGYNVGFPDRSEYFFAKPGRGPAADTGADFQDFRFLLEAGGGSASLITDIPIRVLDPELNENTTGFGDMSTTAKVVLLNGGDWMMTQVTKTTFNTGNAKKGLGTGHISMEPGMLFRYNSSDLTFWHGELKYNFPIAGDPAHSGQVLKWGVGVSHVIYETDAFAIIPTFEYTNMWFLDGGVTIVDPPLPNTVVDVDGDGLSYFTEGVRLVIDSGGDLGLMEVGMSFSQQIGSLGYYDSLIRLDMRFIY